MTCRYDIVVGLDEDIANHLPTTSACNAKNEKQKDTDRKISGSAYKLINSRAYHHGTMLINSNLANLDLALSPSKVLVICIGLYRNRLPFIFLTHLLFLKKSLQGGGIDSVRSKVANLIEFAPRITPDICCQAVINEFDKKFGDHRSGGPVVELLDESFLTPEILEEANKLCVSRVESNSVIVLTFLKDPKWIFGQTPKFTIAHEYPGTDIVVEISVHQGVVESCKIKDANVASDAKSIAFAAQLEKDCQVYLVGNDFHALVDASSSSNTGFLSSNIEVLLSSMKANF